MYCESQPDTGKGINVELLPTIRNRTVGRKPDTSWWRADVAASTALDAHRAALYHPGVETHVASALAGSEHSIMAAIQAAAEPMSPIIQMIMRMPGQIGLVSSMFEALAISFCRT